MKIFLKEKPENQLIGKDIYIYKNFLGTWECQVNVGLWWNIFITPLSIVWAISFMELVHQGFCYLSIIPWVLSRVNQMCIYPILPKRLRQKESWFFCLRNSP